MDANRKNGIVSLTSGRSLQWADSSPISFDGQLGLQQLVTELLYKNQTLRADLRKALDRLGSIEAWVVHSSSRPPGSLTLDELLCALHLPLQSEDHSMEPLDAQVDFTGAPSQSKPAARESLMPTVARRSVMSHLLDSPIAEQDTSVAELSASIAHELNQPLMSIIGNAQAAKKWLNAGPPNLAEVNSSIEMIIRDARMAHETMQHIRALFKQVPVVKKEATIVDTMRDAVRLVQEDPNKREVQIDWRFDENLPKVPVDHIPIQGVFINLISNAIDAVENNRISPLIKIRASVTDQNEMLIQVIDNGPGVNDPEKIFDAFMTTKANGMGIGLAVSRSIIQAHGGRLWAENGPDGGARFNVALPLSPVDEYPSMV
jgi:signal transduction histidine kinase